MSVEKVIEIIESSRDAAVKLLADTIPIKSVSAYPEFRQNVTQMAEWIVATMKAKLPVDEIWLEQPAKPQVLPDGSEIPLPPLVFADIGHDPSKKTVLIYAHYDVQPANLSDGWDHDPWVVTTVKNGDDEIMYGRGTTDDKGPLMGWIHVLEAYGKAGTPIPVNVKFVLEGMEESGSLGFDETVTAHKERNPNWWKSVDFCVVSDNYWLTTEKPCLSYGLRGLTSCQVAIEGPAADLHSGVFGGQVYQPMDDLIYLLSKLKDADDNILIPDVGRDVMPLTDAEEALYKPLLFSPDEKAKSIGAEKIRHQGDKSKALQAVWRNPSLSIHGIEGAFSEAGFKTVIPRRVVGKFSIRLVPNQSGEHIEKCIESYLNKLMAERNSPNKMKLSIHSGRWFYVDPTTSPVFKAAAKAVGAVWGCEPDYTREGGSIPVTLTLSELTQKDLCLIPMGRCDDGAHSQNEKLDMSNYMGGMKVFANFLRILAEN